MNRFNEIEFHILELKKFRESAIIKPSRKEFWLGFIDHSNEDLIKLACNSNDKVKEARAQLEKIRADKELMERIRLEELYEWDVNTGLENARNEGFEKGEIAGKNKLKIEIVLKLLKMNLTIEQIMEATGLSSDEIKKIKESEYSFIFINSIKKTRRNENFSLRLVLLYIKRYVPNLQNARNVTSLSCTFLQLVFCWINVCYYSITIKAFNKK